jgi:hypothetical protein
MIGTVRKHQTWLWAVIIAVVIISFVFFFSPAANMDMGKRSYDLGTIKDRPITKDEFLDAQREMVIYYRLRFGDWPKNEEMMRMMGFDLERETYTRVMLLEKIKDLKINVSPEATAQLIADIFKQGDGRALSLEMYQKFVKENLEANGYTAEDFERFAQHEVAQQHLISVYGAPGRLITPEEVKTAYQRENETITADGAFFIASNYLAGVSVTDDALTRYFNLNKAKYRIPEKIQVDYVQVPLSNYYAYAEEQLAKITNLSLNLETYYNQQGGTNFFRDEKTGKGLTFDEAKPKIRNDLRDAHAANEAKKKVYDFINAVDAHLAKNPGDKKAFATVAAEQKLPVTQTPPFDQRADPDTLKLPASFMRDAFSRSDEEKFSTSPVVGEDAVYALWLANKIDGRFPELAEVKKDVTADYKEAEALKAARAAGEKFANDLNSKLADGKKIEEVAAEHKVKTVSIPPFTLSTRSLPEIADKINIENLQNAANRLSAGQASGFVATEQGGAVIYLRDRKAVAADKMAKDLPTFTSRLRDQRQFSAYGEWLRALSDEMKLKTPARSAQK